ncbi:hypothetical protein M0R45_006859 [Rubus argutus]|uniref:Uncharacterized protein n=1 Tax=Rubus argutus TaxID=59490 RepID=A0AAW1YS66_RUBAR
MSSTADENHTELPCLNIGATPRAKLRRVAVVFVSLRLSHRRLQCGGLSCGEIGCGCFCALSLSLLPQPPVEPPPPPSLRVTSPC